MAGNVTDLIKAAHAAGVNRQAALDAARAVAAQVAASRPAPPAAPSSEPSGTGEPNTASS